LKTPELQANLETGMGAVLCPPEWFKLDADIRIELLSNWIYALERMCEATAVQMNAENAIRKAMKK
jgi:hypothetical protein